MVKILNTSLNKAFFNSEQYNDCSSMLMNADDPPLEELDPAILSCGLPAIVLSDIQPRPPRRYTANQLQAMRKSPLCLKRPAVADDPRISQFNIWKTVPMNQFGRGCRPYVPRSDQKDDRGDDRGSIVREKPSERSNVHQKYHSGRENGFTAPRFRRNFEFSSRGQHVFVKGGNQGDENNNRHQDTAVEEEPEWMAAGPTSRLDTIELRGFDEDVSPNASLDKATNSSDPKLSSTSNISTSTAAEKHVSFYDDLQHYEHVQHQKHHGSTQGRDDVESVATSNTSSPPPARSTPTKNFSDLNNLSDDKLEAGGNQKQKSPPLPHNGINVHNFEEFMKFDSFLGPEPSANTGDDNGSRFKKLFSRNGNSQNQPTGSSFDARRQTYQQNHEAFGTGYDNNRYHFDRPQQYPTSAIPRGGFRSLHQRPDSPEQPRLAEQSESFKRLIDMVIQQRATTHMMVHNQFFMELLNKNQQSENLRRMLMKNAMDNLPDQNQQQSRQAPRVPSQRELQFHTQTIMQNALIRKKLQDDRKIFLDHTNRMAIAAAVATSEPNPVVQQFMQSVNPNMQRSLSVLNQTASAVGPRQQMFQQFPAGTTYGGNRKAAHNQPMFSGGPSEAELSASLSQILQTQPQPQQKPRSGRRFSKGSVGWNNFN